LTVTFTQPVFRIPNEFWRIPSFLFTEGGSDIRIVGFYDIIESSKECQYKTFEIL